MATLRAPDFGGDFLPPTAMLFVANWRRSMDVFTRHPESVGESYLEHLGSAWGFAFTMLGGAAACLLHGLFPFAFQASGSRRIVALHARMVANRHRQRREPEGADFAAGI
jgi:hypothetical protein